MAHRNTPWRSASQTERLEPLSSDKICRSWLLGAASAAGSTRHPGRTSFASPTCKKRLLCLVPWCPSPVVLPSASSATAKQVVSKQKRRHETASRDKHTACAPRRHKQQRAAKQPATPAVRAGPAATYAPPPLPMSYGSNLFIELPLSLGK